MILRRITQHVRDQNWTAIGIDFVIVVVGVFLGIQVSNWDAAQADKARGHAYLERIRDDLASDVAAIRARIPFNAAVAAYGDQALAYLESGEEERDGDWSTVLAFFQASQLFPFSQNNATYDELRSAGELRLIGNQELRSALAEYYVTGSGMQYDFISRHVPDYRETIRGLMPSVVTDHVWEHCHEEQGLSYQRLLACDSPISDEEVQAALADFLSEPELKAQLRSWMSTLATLQTLLATNEAGARDLAARIERELQR